MEKCRLKLAEVVNQTDVHLIVLLPAAVHVHQSIVAKGGAHTLQVTGECIHLCSGVSRVRDLKRFGC